MSNAVKDIRAKYNANGNAIVPNSFQTPNIFVDRLMFYLTPEENVVLQFAVRRIIGFQDNIINRTDNISLSQFTDGITKKDGTPLSMGCGLSTNAVRNALSSLDQYKILIPTTEKPDPRKGQEYWLQADEHQIDWDGLEERRTRKIDKYKRRTKKATAARKGVSSDDTLSSDDSLGVTSDDSLGYRGTTTQNTQKPTETHINADEIEKITNDANKTVDFILENERKSQEKESKNETYPHRDKFPEAIREWIDIYVKLTGQHPLKKDVSKWLMDGQDWIDAGFVKKDIIDAYNKSKGDENGYGAFSVTSPGSLTKTANMFAGLRRQGADEEFQRPEWKKYVPEEGNYVPNPNSR